MVDVKTFMKNGFDDTKSKDIVADGQQRGFIDSDFYPTDMVPSLRLWTSEASTKYALGTPISATDVKYLIESVFNKNIVYYPIRIPVKDSIMFNSVLNENSPSQKIISSLAGYLKITFTNLDKSVGKFIKKQYDQVQTEISDDQSVISISGDPIFVSEALQKLRYQPYLPQGQYEVTSNVLQSKVEIQIEDSINKQQPKLLKSYQELGFIKYNSQPTIKNPLSIQFGQSFSGSIMYVEQDFVFTFNQDSFQHEDPLTYTAYMRHGSNDEEITMKKEGDWIHFDSSNLKFTGSASYSKLGSTYTVVIKASDGTYSNEDTFVMKFYSIPFAIVFNRFIACVSGLSGLIVVWQIRGMIHMIFCRKRIKYSTEIAKVGEEYHKQIPVVVPYIQRCSQFLKIFLKHVQVIHQKELLKEKRSMQLVFLKITYIYYFYLNKRLCIKRYKHPIEYFVVTKTLEHDHEQNRNNTQGDHVQTNSNQKTYNMIDMDKVTEHMLNYTNSINSEDRIVPKKWFKSKHHINIRILQGLLNYQYMKELDKPTFKVFKTLKKKAVSRRKYKSANYQFFSPLDWYLEFARIEVNEEDIYNKDHEIRLPHVIVNPEKIMKIYHQKDKDTQLEFQNKMKEIDEQSFFVDQNYEDNPIIDIENCNGHLLIENIKNYALGITKQLGFWASILQPARGCSVHVDPSTINLMKAMRKTSSLGIVRKVKELISMDYVELELCILRKLPNWLSFEWQNGSIYLKGTPQKKDVRNFQIRLEDLSQFILFSFQLLVIEGDQQAPLQKQHEKGQLSFDDLEGIETLNVMIKKAKSLKKQNKLKKLTQKSASEQEQMIKEIQIKDENQKLRDENPSESPNVNMMNHNMGSLKEDQLVLQIEDPQKNQQSKQQ